MRMSKKECVNYLTDLGLPIPVKSACIGCPYRSASEWLEMQDDAPAEWLDAVSFDEEHRHNPFAQRDGSTADELYIYQSGPLRTADLVADARKQRKHKQLPLLCEGGYCHA